MLDALDEVAVEVELLELGGERADLAQRAHVAVHELHRPLMTAATATTATTSVFLAPTRSGSGSRPHYAI